MQWLGNLLPRREGRRRSASGGRRGELLVPDVFGTGSSLQDKTRPIPSYSGLFGEAPEFVGSEPGVGAALPPHALSGIRTVPGKMPPVPTRWGRVAEFRLPAGTTPVPERKLFLLPGRHNL